MYYFYNSFLINFILQNESFIIPFSTRHSLLNYNHFNKFVFYFKYFSHNFTMRIRLNPTWSLFFLYFILLQKKINFCCCYLEKVSWKKKKQKNWFSRICNKQRVKEKSIYKVLKYYVEKAFGYTIKMIAFQAS